MIFALTVSPFSLHGDFVDDLLRSTVSSQRQAALLSAKSGNYDKALELIDNAIEKSKNDPDIICNKIVILYMADRPEKAIEAFKQLPADYQIPGYLLPVIGKLYHQIGKDNLAAIYLEKALKLDPQNKDIRNVCFDAYINLGRFDLATKLCDEMTQNQADQQWVKDASLRIKHLQAIKLARAEQYDKAEKLLAEAEAENPKDLSILYDRIVIASWANQHQEAVKLFAKLPANAAPPYYVMVEAARSFLNVKDLKQAKSCAEKALQQNPESRNAAELLMAVLLQGKNYEAAAHLLVEYPKLAPELKSLLTKAMQNDGALLARAGKYAEAEKMLKAAGELSKNNPAIIGDLVVTYSWANRHQEAVKLFNSLPKDSNPPYYVLVAAARSFLESNQPKQAEDCARKALQQNADGKDAAVLLLNALLREKKYEAAEQLLAEYPKLLPTQKNELVKAMQNEGALLARAEKYSDAEKMLKAAIKLSGNDPAVAGDLVVNYSWANRHKDALKLFETLPKNYQIPPYVLSEVTRSYKEDNQADKAIIYYRKILAADPKKSDVAQAVAALLAATGHFDQSEKFIVARCAKYPQEASALWRTLAEALKNRAAAEARVGHLDLALNYIKDAIKKDAAAPGVMNDYIAILSWNGKDREAVEKYEALPPGTVCPVYVLKAVAGSYEKLGNYDRALEIWQKILKMDVNNTDARPATMRLWIKSGNQDKALAYVERSSRLMGKDDAVLLAMLGDAYLDAGKPAIAGKQYTRALKADPECADALTGMARIMIKEKKWKEADQLAGRALRKNPNYILALYAKAEALEAMDDFLGSYRCYEKIVSLPGGARAISGQYRILNTIGATGKALEMIDQGGPQPVPELKKNIIGDRGAEKVQREDARPALDILRKNIALARKENSKALLTRSLSDKILVERQQEMMRKVIDSYEALLKENIEPPYWTVQAAGDAYLYFRKPEIALKLYRKAEKQLDKLGINRYPNNYNLKMGIYYALIEEERFVAAGKVLDQIEKEVYAFAAKSGQKTLNWDAMSVAVERAWWLTYQDRLPEAEKYLEKLRKMMPMNTDVMNAQAYLHYYRGWPRRALEDFKIVNTRDDVGQQSKVGLAYTLDENGQEKEARKLAKELQTQYPSDNAVKRLIRNLRTEELTTDIIGFSYSQEQGQADGFTLSNRLEQPIEPNRKAYVETVWKHVMKGGLEDDDIPNTVEIFRNGFGVDWEVCRDLTLRGGFSIDYLARYPAGQVGFDYRINDHWTLAADYTNYTLNAPGWIYLDGGYGQEYTTSLRYRASEDFNADFNFGQMFLSDNNIRTSFSARQDKAVWTWAFWKIRFAMEESLTSDSVIDTNYYANRCNVFLYTVPYVEHTWYRHYETAVMDRFYVAPGIQVEDQYQPKFAGYLRYEQEWKFNDRFSLTAGITGTRRNYDGEGSYGFAIDTGVVCRF